MIPWASTAWVPPVERWTEGCPVPPRWRSLPRSPFLERLGLADPSLSGAGPDVERCGETRSDTV